MVVQEVDRLVAVQDRPVDNKTCNQSKGIYDLYYRNIITNLKKSDGIYVSSKIISSR